MKVAQKIAETRYFIKYNNVFEEGQWHTKWSYSQSPEQSPPLRISSWWSFDILFDKWTSSAVDSVSEPSLVGLPAQMSYIKTKGFEFVVRGHRLFYGVVASHIDTPDGDFITNLRIYWVEFDPDLSTLNPPIYLGTAAPPPSFPKTSRKKMNNCCSCNTIATIVENQSLIQLKEQQKLFENLKDHIDQRALEIIYKDLEHLKALNFEDFLKAIMKRINESESNLWNGPGVEK